MSYGKKKRYNNPKKYRVPDEDVPSSASGLIRSLTGQNGHDSVREQNEQDSVPFGAATDRIVSGICPQTQNRQNSVRFLKQNRHVRPSHQGIMG